MALAEVLPPLPENESFRPQLVESMSEGTPVSDLTPPEDLDIFIDDGISNRMRTLILDDTIKIAASGRSCRENYGTWEESDLVEYGQWLCRFLNIAPDGSGDTQLRQHHIVRASKLGVGPSYKVFKNVLGKKALLNLKQAMGEKAPRNMFTDKSEAWCVSQGIVLANSIGGRPTAPLMDDANKTGTFPTSNYIKDHFRLTTYHELIGYPSLKGGDVVDFDKWGAAFKRQNGPDTPLNFANVNELAKQERGPWHIGVARVYPVDDMYDKFDRRATAEYWRQITEDQALASKQASMIGELRNEDRIFEEATDLTGGEELRRVWGGYRLVTELISDIDRHTAAEIATGCAPYELADRISTYRPDMKLADIKTWAELLEVSTALWPYRFHSADLRVENAVSGVMLEIVPLPAPAQSESATAAQTRLEIRRQRRLARLAANGLGIEAPDAAYDISRFAKHGGKFTPDEMHDLQNVVRRGDRKAKRLELLGDELSPAERQEISRIVRVGNDTKEVFIKANAGLVRHFLMPKFGPRRTPEQLDEILQAGEIGVMKALYKFDPDRGFKFGTYAEWWIRREAFACARRQNYGLTLSQDDDSALRSADNRGELDTDEPTDDELAFLQRVKSVASLNKPIKTDATAELGDILADDFAAAPEEAAISRADASRLFESLEDEDGLKLRHIVSQRFGLTDGVERMPQEIAAEIGINSPAAAQRVKIAINRIRKAQGIRV